MLLENKLVRQIKLYYSMVMYGRRHNLDFAHEHFSFYKEMCTYLTDVKEMRVLDVGCGKSMWLTLLLHSAGAKVSGVDSEFVSSQTGLNKFLQIVKSNGIERAVRTLIWEIVFAKPYYTELAKQCSSTLNFEALDVRISDSTQLDFPDNTFDIIVSHEVFEHLPDIPKTLKELKRVLKPEGVTYIYIHNFTSLSGGHHIEWKYPDAEPSEVVPPWDHLREQQFSDIPSWINGWRIDDYLKAFAKEFEIKECVLSLTEGESLLTTQLRTELAKYSEEELLTKGFVIVAFPKDKIKNHN